MSKIENISPSLKYFSLYFLCRNQTSKYFLGWVRFSLFVYRKPTQERERERGVECFWDEWFQMVLRRQPARATVFPSGTPASDTE